MLTAVPVPGSMSNILPIVIAGRFAVIISVTAIGYKALHGILEMVPPIMEAAHAINMLHQVTILLL